MAYSRYFRRPISYCSQDAWDESVVKTHRELDAQRFADLYRDCFSHHFLPSVTARSRPLEARVSRSPYIEPADLTARFLEAYYVAPPIYATASRDDHEKERCLCQLTELVTAVASSGGPQNTFSYVMGNVGAGKTLLAAKLVHALREHPAVDGKRNLPVVINLETVMHQGHGQSLRPVTDELLIDVARAVGAAADTWLIADAGMKEFWDGHQRPGVGDIPPRRYFASLVRHLRNRELRPVVIIDNTDRYHFHYSKFIFCDDSLLSQKQSVLTNFEQLVNLFTQSPEISSLGLAVVLTCRDYVYREIEQHRPEVVATPNHTRVRVYQLGSVDVRQVVESRLKLLSEAVLAVQRARGGTGRSLRVQLEAVEVAFQEGLKENAALKIVKGLSHQGHRSFVEFLSRLSVDVSQEYPILERVLVKQPHALQRLYVADLVSRYTQNRRHFPNMFLNDTLITADGDSDHQKYFVPHHHTYWLKYLLLKYVASSPYGLVAESLLREMFVTIDGYQEYLFNLVLGSLAMQNESSCLDIEYVNTTRRVLVTDRGRTLVAERPGDIGFCFEVEYLQLVTDDFLLSFPCPWYSQIFVDADLRYSLGDYRSYGEGSQRCVTTKAPAVMYFLRVLEASYAWERAFRPGILRTSEMMPLAPDFDRIYDRTLNSYRQIVRALMGERAGDAWLQSLTELRDRLRSDAAFDNFFSEYGASDALVVR